MRIVQVCGWYFPDSLGGTEAYVAGVAARLSALGHHVVIAAPDPGAHDERSYQHEGIPVYRYPTALAPSRDEAQHVVPVRGAERFHAWVRSIRPDVVHFHTFVTGVGIHEIRAARAAGARVYATTHSGGLGFLCQRGTMLRWGTTLCDGKVTPAKCGACELQHRGLPRPVADAVALVPPVIGRAARMLPGRVGTTLGMTDLIARNQTLQRSMLAEVDGFVVLTEGARNVVTANDGNGARVLLNRLGVRCDASELNRHRMAARTPTKSPLTVAYLGRFDRIKGVHDLARAVRSLDQSVPIRVEFRGPVSNLHELAVVNELKAIVGPDAWVAFKDPIEPHKVFDYLRTVDLLVCPSRTLEGGPTVALEAMAVGTPVLATNIGALSEIITDGVNGRLVAPTDVPALARALTEIAGDPAGTIDTWRRALPSVRSMDDVARDYLQLYSR